MGRGSSDINTVRVAYFVSTRELADNEPISDTDHQVNESHRGNLPKLMDMLAAYNRIIEQGRSGGPRIEIAVIVSDDDQLRRDFSDLGIPVHQEPSSSFASLRRDKANGESIADFRSRKAQAKAEYEQRLLGLMRERNVDIVVSDRYMRLFGPTFLSEYLGLTLNSHPAILPDNPGATPTSNALERCRGHGYAWTGNTLHIVDHGEDTGPAIMQAERTPVLANDTEAMLRSRNYQNESKNIFAGLVGYVRDPAVRQLIRFRRELPGANGSTEQVRSSMSVLSGQILQSYRAMFDSFYSGRNDIEAGRYRYCARLMMRRLARQEQARRQAETPARPRPMLRPALGGAF